VLGQLNFDGKNKVEVAIERLKMYEPENGYYLAFSGGKDSVVIKALADMAGVKYDAHYNLTTVDPPELVRFIKDVHPDVKIEKPDMTMWQLIKYEKFLPTRSMRFCCRELKERGGKGRTIITGIRWGESPRRKNAWNVATPSIKQKSKRDELVQRYKISDNDEKARVIEICYTLGKFVVAPIVDWTDADVWEFIKTEKIPYCKLYDEGFKRLGCIGCPMSNKRIEDLLRWPTYYRRYMACAEWLIKNTKTEFKTAQEYMRWWLELKPGKHIPELDL
jgi:phosphoadenosine phosphosulfate reductase